MEGERAREGGDGEREIERGTSITPFNLPVIARGRLGKEAGPWVRWEEGE